MRRAIAFMTALSLTVFGAVCAEAESGAFSAEERAYISAHSGADNPVIVGADDAFSPFFYRSVDGEYIGLTVRYLKLISEVSGLRFSVETDFPWKDAGDKMTGGELDMVADWAYSAVRDELFIFSEPYAAVRTGFIQRTDSQVKITSLESAGKIPIAVQNGTAVAYMLLSGGANLTLYDTSEEVVDAVSDGREFVGVGSIEQMKSYADRQGKGSALQYIEYDHRLRGEFSFASLDPVLISVLNKSMSMCAAEMETVKIKELGGNALPPPVLRAEAFLVAAIAFAALSAALLAMWLLSRRKAKARDENRREINAALDSRDEFLTRMSHEIRTPLNAVSGMSYLLRKSGLKKEQEAFLNKIDAASKDLLGIVDDMLNFSSMNSDSLTLEETEENLGKLLDEVSTRFFIECERKKLSFSFSPPPNLPSRAVFDRRALTQILENLLSNAVKFTSAGSVKFSARRCLDSYVFEVSDTGDGIPGDKLNRLFRPFEQAECGITRSFGGIGMGLFTVRKLTELMGGTVEVQSSPGLGSVFSVTIPLKAAEDAPEAETAEKFVPSGKILLVEDNEINREIAESLLQDEGYEVISAVNGFEGYETFVRNRDAIRAVLMDLHMPVMDGYESARKIKDASPGVPIAAVTADVTDGTNGRCREAGMAFYVSKPYDPDRLSAVVAEMIRLSLKT